MIPSDYHGDEPEIEQELRELKEREYEESSEDWESDN